MFTVDSSTTETSLKCLAYFDAGGTCPDSTECVLQGDNPVCQ